MRLALSALAAVVVVVAVALLAKSAKAYGERPSVQITWASTYVEEPGQRPAPRSKNRPAVPSRVVLVSSGRVG